uniref:Secreted peptide prohormone 18 n=1 Tax=Schmidtea mediterranea TaxID=79327 RepID=E3T7U6_SCHMD|nr:secreted peptide prohormone 18 [Schmidtea mediterranea]
MKSGALTVVGFCLISYCMSAIPEDYEKRGYHFFRLKKSGDCVIPDVMKAMIETKIQNHEQLCAADKKFIEMISSV